MRVHSISEAQNRYGEIIDGQWADEGQWMVIIPVPAELQGMINSATGSPTKKIYCNKDMAPVLQQAFQNIIDRGLIDQVKTFDGCYQIRAVRGTINTMSWHSYGLAIDINASENQLGQEPQISSELVECFTDAGFTWGGNFKRKDGMHFSYGAE